ncbi:MAG: type II secretion system protein GspC [Candidatus Binatia bacterium]
MDVVVAELRIIFLGVRCVLLTCVAYFCALSVNIGIATKFAPPPVVPNRSETYSLPSLSTKPPLSAYAIVYTRDIFNTTKAPLLTKGNVVASTTNTNLRLLGTATSQHGRAFAILEDQTTRAQGLYREGDLIAPGVLLVKVSWDRITIERQGQRETLLLPKEPTTPSSQSPVTLVSTVTSNSNAASDSGVRQVSQDAYHIDRREVDYALNNLSDLFTQVRAVPYSPTDGVVQGFRLFQIKPESLIDRIGLKNGDIIQRVNGVEISDPSTAFQLLQDLQGHPQIRVDVLRNHQPTTLSYEIR